MDALRINRQLGEYLNAQNELVENNIGAYIEINR
jgi:hypothetical protein